MRPKRAAYMQETTEHRSATPATNDLVAAAQRAEAWAGEPLLHNGEEPTEVLAQGTARRNALDEATAVLDPTAEATILDALRQEFAGRSILAALSRPDAARGFDRVVVIDRGRLKEDGDYQTLTRRDGSLAPLLAAE